MATTRALVVSVVVLLAVSCSDDQHTRDAADSTQPTSPSSTPATTAPSTDATEVLDPVVAALVAFARSPSPQRFAAIPLHETVELQFRGFPQATVTAGELYLADRWLIETDNGQASPLDLIAGSPFELESGRGPRQRCTGPTVDSPADTTWLVPIEVDSCLQWFAIDLSLTSGEIHAISLDTWDP